MTNQVPAESPEMASVADALGRRYPRLILLGLLDGVVENERDLSLRGKDAEEIQAELEREHLPKLEAAGFIEWDRETGEISKGERFEEVERYLRLVEKRNVNRN